MLILCYICKVVVQKCLLKRYSDYVSEGTFGTETHICNGRLSKAEGGPHPFR
jgi:hypothetical protein